MYLETEDRDLGLRTGLDKSHVAVNVWHSIG